MQKQTTMLTLILSLTAVTLLSAQQPSVRDTLLTGLGSDVQSYTMSGVLSATGDQALHGVPFTASMDSTGAFLLTLGGPFGITAARMYAVADSFVMVNYLQHEVWLGKSTSSDIQRISRLPLPAPQLMELLKGSVPGNPDRFSKQSTSDNAVLYTSADSVGVEYVLVDTVHRVLTQYQRKDSTGTMELDVAFQDLRNVDTRTLPHFLLIRTNGKKQEVTLTIRSIEVNNHTSEPLHLSIPTSFARRQFN